ncbi:MAG TPA: 4a-hydroxytetrahydrobiopterin dehydratase [Solirubrobacter sp.]|nr:4a-hydroxytetrahydrobiopterin dehydratase [Solirubrobacter sp.]
MTRDGWKVKGNALVRELAMRDFDEALGVVTRIAEAAEDYFRRPDMCISEFNRVRIIVANPHHAGITDAERRLAAKVDAVVDGG